MKYQQIEMPVNLTSIAADYLAARNGLRVASSDKSRAAIISLARKNALADVLTNSLCLRVQVNFGEIISLVDALDAFEFPAGVYSITMEWFTEMADDIIDEYMGFARTATATMAKAIDAVEDAFAQMDERYPPE